MKGVDYSFARPTGAAIKAAGFSFALRYLPYNGDGGKGLTLDEIDDLRANGIDIGIVFEKQAERHLGGYNVGVADAQLCGQQGAGLGFPQDLPFYFAVDFDAQPAHYKAIDDYQRGAISVLGLPRVGIYGHERLLWHSFGEKTASWYWQCLAWSYGKHFPMRHLYQYQNGVFVNGGAVDYNEAYGESQGLWKAEEGMSSAEFDRLVKAGWGSIERLEELEAGGNLDLEGRVDKHEQDQAAHSGHDHDSTDHEHDHETSEMAAHLVAAGDELRKAGGV